MSQFFTSVLPMNIQDQFPLGLVGSSHSPGASQETSLAPRFKSINSSALSFLYSPTPTSIHDHWKNHCFQLFPNESVLRIRWPKYGRFSFSISPSNEYSGLIFFRMDWLDLLAVQGTLKSLLQHHGFKSIISEWWGLDKDISTGHSFQRILQDHVPYTWPTPKGL